MANVVYWMENGRWPTIKINCTLYTVLYMYTVSLCSYTVITVQLYTALTQCHTLYKSIVTLCSLYKVSLCSVNTVSLISLKLYSIHSVTIHTIYTVYTCNVNIQCTHIVTMQCNYTVLLYTVSLHSVNVTIYT